MKIGTEDKKKLGIAIVVGVLGIASIFYIYNQLATPDVPAPVAAPVVRTAPAGVVVKAPSQSGSTPVQSAASQSGAGGAAGAGAKSAAPVSLDPSLKMGAMLLTEALVYSGNGRNIFSATSAPVAIPVAVAPARPKPVTLPPPPVATGPPPTPPPPPIDLKFFGTATAKNGTRQVFLLHGEDVFLASAGDIVQRRYRVISIAANSVVMEDMTNNNRQTLPLLTN